MNLIDLAEKKLDKRGEYIVGSDYKIFLDAAGLMQTSFIDYFKKITPELKDKKTGIIVIERVVTELKGLTFNKKSDTRIRAKAALDLIKDGIKNGVIVSMESTGGKQKADDIFEAIFTRFRGRYNLALITTDGDLTKGILALNTSNAVDDIKSIRVYQMNNGGYLEQITPKQDSIDDIVGSQIVPFKKSRTPVGEDYYNPINISKVPITGDIVRSEKNLTIKLTKKIASGGEGSIYEFNVINYKKSPETRTKKYLAKIYHEGIIDKAKVEKIKLIINNKSCQKIKGVCFPISLLYNENNDPVGYTMKRAGTGGNEVFTLQRSLFIKPLAQKKLEGWRRINLVTLCINLLNTINALHKYNIIMGDLNAGNILFDKNANVYFIDTDSYQIENYPCPVGTATFSHPDILTDVRKKNFKSFLRTEDHERFAVSTLLFMILLPGLPPYSYKGGSNPAANVKSRKFVFPFRDEKKNIHHVKNEDVADGQWRFIWSHLPFSIKEAFFETFHLGKMRKINDYEIDSNKNVGMGWINILNKYDWMLKYGKTNNELYASSFKTITTIKNPSKEIVSILLDNKGAVAKDIEKRNECSVHIERDTKNTIIRINSFGLKSKPKEIRSEILNLEQTILDQSIVIEMKDIFPDISIDKTNFLIDSIYGPEGLYLEDFKSKYLPSEISDIRFSRENNHWTIVSKNNQIGKDFIKYCQAGVSKIKISRKLIIKHIIVDGGKKLQKIEKECKKIEKNELFKNKLSNSFISFENDNWGYISIDRDSRILYIFTRSRSVRKYIKNEINKVQLYEAWGNFKKVYIPKRAIHDIINNPLFIAIEMKYLLTNKDYLIHKEDLKNMLMTKKPFIGLYTSSVDIEQKIINEINQVVSWENTEKILIPIKVQEYLDNNNLLLSELLSSDVEENDKPSTSLKVQKIGNNLIKSLIPSPFEYSVHTDRKKLSSWIKKYSSSGEIVIRAKFKKDLTIIVRLINSKIKKILNNQP